MKLDMLIHQIHGIEFGAATAVRGGMLTIDRLALRDAVQTACGLQIGVELARPGESVRLSNVLDVIEPRCKADGEETYFPGFHGPLRVAGTGATRVLRGVTVVETGRMRGLIGGVIDMSGPAAALTPFADLFHIVLETTPSDGMDKAAYARAIKRAGLEAACYLARACRQADPDERAVFDLDMPPAPASFPPALPRLGYVCMLHALGDTRESFFYGQCVRDFSPTIVHPNEILDGAIVSHHYDISPAMKNNTYSFQNHPVICELMNRHGDDLVFAGVVLANQPVMLEEKERSALLSARLSQHVLKADAVIITKEGAGAGDYDLMRQCRAHEEAGIHTVLIDSEQINAEGISDMPLIDITPHADAMVSTGNTEQLEHLPVMERVIGGESMFNVSGSLQGPVTIEHITIPNANSSLGFTRLGTVHY